MSGPPTSWRDAAVRSGGAVREWCTRRWEAARARPRLALALAALLSLGTALRLYGLGAESLWIDEVITVVLVRRFDTLELLIAIPRNQPHLPPYYVLLALWRRAVGTSPAAMRALSALCSVAVLPLVYALGARLFDRRAGLLALAVTALSRFQLAYAQEIRMYALLTLLTTASFYCLLRREEPRWAVGYVCTAVGAAYVHPFGGLSVLGGLAYLGIAHRTEAGTWPGTAGDRRAPAAVALALVPLAVAAAAEFATGFGLTFVPVPGPRTVALALQSFLGTWPNAWVGVAAAVALGLAAAATVAAAVRHRDHAGSTLLVGCWLLTPLATLVAVSHLLTPVFWPRYVAGAAPAAYLLVGRGLALVWPTNATAGDGPRYVRRSLRVGLVLLLLLSLVPSVVAYHTTDQHEEWDRAVPDIESRAAPDALVLVNNCMTVTAYEEYATRSELDVAGVVGPESGVGGGRTPDARVRATVRNRSEVWLVLSHVVPRERERMRRLLDERHDPTWNRSYVGIEVVRYERPDVPTDTTRATPQTECRDRLVRVAGPPREPG